MTTSQWTLLSVKIVRICEAWLCSGKLNGLNSCPISRISMFKKHICEYIDGLVQDNSNSIANALELLPSCTKSLTWKYYPFGQRVTTHQRFVPVHIGLVQDCSITNVLALEILQSSTKPSIWLVFPFTFLRICCSLFKVYSSIWNIASCYVSQQRPGLGTETVNKIYIRGIGIYEINITPGLYFVYDH